MFSNNYGYDYVLNEKLLYYMSIAATIKQNIV